MKKLKNQSENERKVGVIQNKLKFVITILFSPQPMSDWCRLSSLFGETNVLTAKQSHSGDQQLLITWTALYEFYTYLGWTNWEEGNQPQSQHIRDNAEIMEM